MISGHLGGKFTSVRLLKQVSKKETIKHVSQSFNSLAWFGKKKARAKKINNMLYFVLCEQERQISIILYRDRAFSPFNSYWISLLLSKTFNN